MREIAIWLTLGLLVGVVTASPALCQTVQFQGLGALPGTTEGSFGADLSADGTVAVGGSPSSASVQEAWRWTSAGGMQGLGFLPGESTSFADVITSDGRFIGGNSGADAFRWSSGGGFVAIDDGMLETRVAGISDDGGTIVGNGQSITTLSAWRWKPGTGIDLAIPGDVFTSWTTFWDLSADGQTILASADIFDDSTPYLRTDLGNTYLGVGFLAQFCQCGNPPRAMTPNASVVVGIYEWTEAYRWEVALDEGQLLGYLDPGVAFPASDARDVSADGSIVVGSSTDTGGDGAFIWSQEAGMQAVFQILVSNGIDLSGWQLTEAVAISADGTVILGNGTNPSAVPEAWLAVIPASAWLPPSPQVPAVGSMGLAALAAFILISGAAASRAGVPGRNRSHGSQRYASS